MVVYVLYSFDEPVEYGERSMLVECYSELYSYWLPISGNKYLGNPIELVHIDEESGALNLNCRISAIALAIEPKYIGGKCMSIDLGALNYLAILIGGILYMIYGAIYYSLLVGKENQSKGALKYVISVIVAFISSIFIAILVQATSSNSLLEGAAIGGIIGILISIVYLKNSLFGLVNKRNFLIAIGDHFIIFTLLGALHSLFV